MSLVEKLKIGVLQYIYLYSTHCLIIHTEISVYTAIFQPIFSDYVEFTVLITVCSIINLEYIQLCMGPK